VSEEYRQELLWRDELLQKPDLEVDKGFRLSLQNSARVTEAVAAKEVTGDKNVGDALRQLKEMIDFLRQPPDELTDEELEFRNGLMSEYRLASFLRIYEDGVWYAPICVFLRDDVFPKWLSSSIKKSRARRRGTAGKRDGEKKFKKNLASVREKNH
jgi:hypothetical protein